MTRRRGFPLVAAVGAAVLALAATALPGPATHQLPAAALSLVAVPDTLTSVHDRKAIVAAPGVLANDVTVLGTTAVLDSQPSNGTVTLAANGGYSYAPDPFFVGTDVFRYHDFDGLLSTNSTTVTITVTNKAPVALDDRWSANAGRTETVDAPGVLENDGDPDGDELQAKLVSGPGHGTLTLRADGGFDYTADPGFDNDDTFTYVATDGIAQSSPATVTMHVSASGTTPPPPTPTPTPRPTPTPTPRPTPIPLPSVLPSLPTVSLPPLSTPTPTPTPTPGASVGPGETVPPDGGPRPSGSPRPSPTPSGGSSSSAAPSESAPATGAAGGPGGSGGPGTGGSGGPGGPAGASPPAVLTDADGPVFHVGGGPALDIPLVGAAFAGFDSIDWAVPALTLTVPGLLLMLAVLAQVSAGAVWLPFVRRWLGAFGIAGRRRRQRPD